MDDARGSKPPATIRQARPDGYTPSGQDHEYNALLDRVALLEYQLGEVIGCVEEYMQMPTLSLKSRMHSAVARAKKATCEHDWQQAETWLIDRCSKCGEERA